VRSVRRRRDLVPRGHVAGVGAGARARRPRATGHLDVVLDEGAGERRVYRIRIDGPSGETRVEGEAPFDGPAFDVSGVEGWRP
jgi:hypothetical protein